MTLSGRAAIVTGGSSGIGEGICSALLNAGAQVFNFDLTPPKCETAAKFVKCDVSKEESVTEALKAIQDDIYVCVNCAGITIATRVATARGLHPLAKFQKVIDVNLVGTFNVTRLVASRMIKQAPKPLPAATKAVQALHNEERGVVINIASIAAFDGEGGQVAYSASKAGIVGMTLPMARDLRKFGIRVVTICPGLVTTPLVASIAPPEVIARLSKGILTPQRFAHVDEIASFVLCVVESSYLNAETIRLDGGLRLSSL